MLRNALITTALLMVFISFAATANAVVIPNEVFKWEQLPDLQPCGMDVMATVPNALADDYLCTVTGRLTKISIWGSWYMDQLPQNATGGPDASQVGIRMAILSDMPAGPNNLFSKPEELLWETYFDPGTFTVEDPVIGEEGWYNPYTGFYEPVGDTMAFKYIFDLDPANTFFQRGSEDQPIVYWLAIEAFPVGAEPGALESPLFGWKSSLDHWNDDATFIQPDVTPEVPWQELRYPDGHLLQGESMDLAFSIVGVPEPMSTSLIALGGLLALIRRRHI